MQTNTRASNVSKSQAGFSLVELMVVVGIIGLLAAIAVPQFSKFQARARQAEAKTMAASIFTGEQAFFSEWNGYTASMSAAGVATTGNKVRYNGEVGNASGTVCAGTYPVGAPADASVTVLAASPGAALDTGMTTPTMTAGAPVCTNTSPKAFTASIMGDPNNSVGQTVSGVNCTAWNCDRWTITQNKVIAQVQSGLQ